MMWGLVVGCLLASLASAQSKPTDSPTADSTKQPAPVRINGLQIDRMSGTLTIATEVCLREGPLEFLLCGWGSKEHESVLHTRAKPSDIHAGLVLLGLAPGKPARWSQDSGEDERLLPPRGAKLRAEVRWNGPDGAVRREDASTFITSENQKRTPPEQYVFVGSAVSPDGRYWADVEGEIISVANFPSSVLDVPFGSSSDDALLEFVARTPAIPPIGTPVDVILTALPGAATDPHARATLDIDAEGEFHLDGCPMNVDALLEATRRFVAAHAQAEVVIRAHPRVRIADVAHARSMLWLGGLRSIRHEWIPVPAMGLPRSLRQFQTARAEWAKRLASPADYIRDPVELAIETLERVAEESASLRSQREILQKYSDYLRAIIAQGAGGRGSSVSDAEPASAPAAGGGGR
jgi:biopolymer transport protein ExbD